MLRGTGLIPALGTQLGSRVAGLGTRQLQRLPGRTSAATQGSVCFMVPPRIGAAGQNLARGSWKTRRLPSPPGDHTNQPIPLRRRDAGWPAWGPR